MTEQKPHIERHELLVAFDGIPNACDPDCGAEWRDEYALAYTAAQRLVEQIDTLHNQLGAESMRCEKAEGDLKRTLEQNESLRQALRDVRELAEGYGPGMNPTVRFGRIIAYVIEATSNPASEPDA